MGLVGQVPDLPESKLSQADTKTSNGRSGTCPTSLDSTPRADFAKARATSTVKVTPKNFLNDALMRDVNRHSLQRPVDLPLRLYFYRLARFKIRQLHLLVAV